MTARTAERDAFWREWEAKGFPKFKPLPPLYREREDGRGGLVLEAVGGARGYLTVGEIAAWAGVSVQAIYQRESAGEFDCGPFPVERIGSAIRIPAETFARWAGKYWKGGEA